MRKKTQRESFRQVRKIIKTKMSGGNLIKVLNTWAVAVIRYSATFIGQG